MVRPSDPRPPLAKWATGEVLEELCLALREVGVHDGWGALSDWSQRAIERVRAADRELRSRNSDIEQRLANLSEETGWRMTDLLTECRAYPDTRPRLRERTESGEHCDVMAARSTNALRGMISATSFVTRV
jgi:hypothetical protein